MAHTWPVQAGDDMSQRAEHEAGARDHGYFESGGETSRKSDKKSNLVQQVATTRRGREMNRARKRRSSGVNNAREKWRRNDSTGSDTLARQQEQRGEAEREIERAVEIEREGARKRSRAAADPTRTRASTPAGRGDEEATTTAGRERPRSAAASTPSILWLRQLVTRIGAVRVAFPCSSRLSATQRRKGRIACVELLRQSIPTTLKMGLDDSVFAEMLRY